LFTDVPVPRNVHSSTLYRFVPDSKTAPTKYPSIAADNGDGDGVFGAVRNIVFSELGMKIGFVGGVVVVGLANAKVIFTKSFGVNTISGYALVIGSSADVFGRIPYCDIPTSNSAGFVFACLLRYLLSNSIYLVTGIFITLIFFK
jgi:hypothetical protein